MAADGAGASWLVDTFAPSALRWPTLGAGQIDELRSALHLIHSQAVFGAETGAAAAAQLPAWTQRLQQMARSAIPDVRWAACCLAGATARTAGVGGFRGHAAAWLAVLLPLTKSSEPRAVQSIAASAATDLLARCQGCAQQAKVDAPAALTRLMPALASLRGVAQHQAEALKATFALLRTGGNQLRPYAVDIEQSCVKLLSSGDDEVRQSAALCLASVPAVTASPKDDFAEWLRIFRKLLDQLRTLLDRWLPAPPPAAAPAAAGGLSAATKKGAGGPVEDGVVAAREVNGLCIAIGAMLHLPFVGLVQVPVGELVQLISQVLRVSQPAAHGEDGIATVLPTLHAEVLQLLAVVAKAVGRRLLPFAASLGEMLRVSICRPRKTLVGRSPAVQHAALVTATVCLGLLRSALAATLGRPILQHIIGSIDAGMGSSTPDVDAHFQENGTASGTGASRGQGSARKRRGRRASAAEAGLDAAESLVSSSRSETVLWVLSTRLLRRIVDCCGTELQDIERLQLDRAVVGWLVKYGLCGADGLGYVPAMSVPTVRLELYALLAASLACPVGTPGSNDDDQQTLNGGRSDQLVKPAGNRDGPSQTGAGKGTGRILPHLHPIARQLFLAGSCNDPAPAVRAACVDGLRLCSNLSQPRARPLHFPPPGSQIAEPVTLASAESEEDDAEGYVPMQVSALRDTSIQQLASQPSTSTAPAADTVHLAHHLEADPGPPEAPFLGQTHQTESAVAPHRPLWSADNRNMQGSRHDEVLEPAESDTNHPNKRARVEVEPTPAAQTVILAQAAATEPAAGTTAAVGAADEEPPTSAATSAGATDLAQQAAADNAEVDGPRFEIVDLPPDSGDDSDSGSDSESESD